MLKFNPLTDNQVAVVLIKNGISPTKDSVTQHSIGDTCWCHPALKGIGRSTLVFNHTGGKVHNYPRYLTSACGEV